MALLHSCRYKLPSDKAEAVLGYRPPVSFPEACRRCVGWLAFADYPVADPDRVTNEPVADAPARAELAS
jgi:hypothetical protein